MKTKLVTLAIFMLLLSTSLASAADKPECKARRRFMLEGKPTPLCFLRQTEAWASPACAEPGTRCKALELLDRARELGRLPDSAFTGGKNPGAVVCLKLGSAVLYATDKHGGQSTFCEAPDHTVIETNAIDTAWNEGLKPARLDR